MRDGIAVDLGEYFVEVHERWSWEDIEMTCYTS